MTLHRFAGVVALVIAAAAACQRAPADIQAKHELGKTALGSITHLTNASISNGPLPFEGEIQLDETRPSQSPVAVTYDIKEDRIRYDAKPTSSSMPAVVHAVADLTRRQVFELNDATKNYVELDSALAARPGPSLEATGTTEAIAGLSCQDMEIVDGRRRIDVCAFKGIPYFDLAGRTKGRAEEPAWAATLTKAKMFPLKVVERDEKGTEVMRLEAKSVEPKTLDETLFVPPTSYVRESPGRYLPLDRAR